jgi:DNA-directed RNA polymerase specialized sigma24 family protein
MRCNEEMAGRETKVAAVPNDGAVAGQERGAAKSALDRGIEALLPNLRRYAQSLTRDVAAGDDLVQECVARALTKLPSLTGRSYDEIASDCVVPVGTVRSRLSRGRRALRALTGVSPSQQSIAGVCQTSAKTPTGAKLSNLTRAYPS